MEASIALQLAAIVVIGIAAQWIAWRIRLPSILILLAAGTVAGPVTGWLRPNALLGEILMPLVSLSVAVILYEGGLSLKLRELTHIGPAFAKLTTVGVFVALVLGTLAARYILDFAWPVAALLGSILVVTGPTVIAPMLRHLRLRGKVSSLLKWEGIVVDPIGALLAVSVFVIVQAVTLEEGLAAAAWQLTLTALVGIVIGFVAAGLLVLSFARFWVPDTLHNPLSLAFVLLAFVLANTLHEEAGLVAVTVMGIVVANQTWVTTRHIAEFKETLTLLLISCLFIVLAARLTPDELQQLNWRSVAFIIVMVLIVRPLSILASTWGSDLTARERGFLACMAPRGIVAAAIASVLAEHLVQSGYPTAIEIVPITFLMVFATVLLYGVIAAPLASRLGLIHTNPQGVLFVGAAPWVRAFAKAIFDAEIPVFLLDSQWDNVRRCRAIGLPALHGSALAEQTREEIDYAGLGKFLAVTSNDEVNSLACLHFMEDFGRQGCYQLPFSARKDGKHEPVPAEYRGRFLFREDLSSTTLHHLAGDDPQIKTTKLTEAFDYEAFLREHAGGALPLAALRPDKVLIIRAAKDSYDPKPGDTLFSLLIPSLQKKKDPSGDTASDQSVTVPESA